MKSAPIPKDHNTLTNVDEFDIIDNVVKGISKEDRIKGKDCYGKKFLSIIKLSLKNLSFLKNLKNLFIWKHISEEHLMELCFLCNGNSEMVQAIIKQYKKYPITNFFNDVVRSVCAENETDQSRYVSRIDTNRPTNQIKDEEKSSCS